jgi:PhnB protein
LPDTSNPIEAGAGSRPLVPEGYHTVTPWIISRDTARLIEFVEQAFGAQEIARIQDERGVIGHAEFRIGDSVIMGFDAKPEWPDTPAFLRLYVEDADAAHQRAIEAGATSVTEVTHLYWGIVSDACGTRWATSGGSRRASRRSTMPRWSDASERRCGSSGLSMFRAP